MRGARRAVGGGGGREAGVAGRGPGRSPGSSSAGRARRGGPFGFGRGACARPWDRSAASVQGAGGWAGRGARESTGIFEREAGDAGRGARRGGEGSFDPGHPLALRSQHLRYWAGGRAAPVQVCAAAHRPGVLAGGAVRAAGHMARPHVVQLMFREVLGLRLPPQTRIRQRRLEGRPSLRGAPLWGRALAARAGGTRGQTTRPARRRPLPSL
jgi:hypothetical protein